MSKRLTRGQYWEIIIVTLILFIIVYRVALVYDYVPEQYHPSVMMDAAYSEIKKDLKIVADANGAFSDLAAWAHERMVATEEYLLDRKLRYQKAEEVSERCKENMIFRFFMYMGDEDNQNCTERNMRVKKATEEINRDVRPQDASSAATTTQPTQNPAPNIPVTSTPSQNYTPPPTYVPSEPVTPAQPQRPREPVSVVAPSN